jgi:crossover junction endodeoxyribonuclease RuvC
MGITVQQFERMKARLNSPDLTKTPTVQTAANKSNHTHQIVLGIDPSLRGTGYGLIQTARSKVEMLECGTIKCPAVWERSRCLAVIAQTLRDLVKWHVPSVCVVEGLFYAQNLQTALIMGEARGAALSAVAEAKLDIFEIAPRKVKQAIVGYGAAQKLAVAKMVQRMLGLPELPAPDAADALALALTHVQEQGRWSLVAPKKI